MESKNKTTITKDVENKQVKIMREFDAPSDEVWNAWTDSKLLDNWWAPKPWKAKTKSMDFRVGGHWLYAMVGPEGEQHWARVDYKTIVPGSSFTANDAFCDEEGNISSDFPSMHWDLEFKETSTGTGVKISITFSNEEDMQKLLEMGFEEGFTAAHGNLDELLEKK